MFRSVLTALAVAAALVAAFAAIANAEPAPPNPCVASPAATGALHADTTCSGAPDGAGVGEGWG